jgi:Fe-S-cluster containining protein
MEAIARRVAALQAVYRLQAAFTAGRELACGPGCDVCCTADVTITTLEGVVVADRMTPRQRSRITVPDTDRYRPTMTINQLAAICLTGESPPDEPRPAGTGGRCRLLDGSRCAVYPQRPFACRCMTSSRTCRRGGSARMSPTLLAVNEICMQVIEHLDPNGCTGNLVDVLAFLDDPINRRQYVEGTAACRHSGLVPNRPLPAVMIPPDQRSTLGPLVQRLKRIVAAFDA